MPSHRAPLHILVMNFEISPGNVSDSVLKFPFAHVAIKQRGSERRGAQHHSSFPGRTLALPALLCRRGARPLISLPFSFYLGLP